MSDEWILIPWEHDHWEDFQPCDIDTIHFPASVVASLSRGPLVVKCPECDASLRITRTVIGVEGVRKDSEPTMENSINALDNKG